MTFLPLSRKSDTCNPRLCLQIKSLIIFYYDLKKLQYYG